MESNSICQDGQLWRRGWGEHLPSLGEKVMSSGVGMVGVKSYVTPGRSGSRRQLRIWFQSSEKDSGMNIN